MSRLWAKGSTRAWRRVRAAVLGENRATNHGRCTLAISDVCTGWATEVHHTRGRAATGDDPRFLTATCGPCNRHTGDPTRHDPPHRPMTRW